MQARDGKSGKSIDNIPEKKWQGSRDNGIKR